MQHFPVVVLVVACLFFGWVPGLAQVGAVLLGTAIVAVFSLGIGLLFATANVFFRDAENIVELCLQVANASGGFMNVGNVSAEERARIEAIADKLGPAAREAFHRELG